MRTHRGNFKTTLSFIFGTLVVVTQPAALAGKPDVMVFKFTLQEACTSGPRGTFAADGRATQPTGIGFSHVAGTVTIDARNGRFSQIDEAVFQSPQGIYPVLTFKGKCTGSFELLDDLTFTITDQVCTPVGQNGPPSGVTTTITGMKFKGQFAPDFQSFVGSSLGLTLELGSDSNGNQFERLCGKTAQGVRTSKKWDDPIGPRPW